MKIALAVLLIFALVVSLTAGLQIIEVVEANFVPTTNVNPILSPTNTTYSTNSLTLQVTVGFALTKDNWIGYSIDGKENVTLTGVEYKIDELWQGVNITVPLPILSEGSHRIDVYTQSVTLNYAVSDSKTVFFTIDTKTPTPTPVGSTDAWVAMAPLPVTGISGVAAISDRIYAVAGSNNVVYEYDPAANSWALKTHVPTSRDSFAVASCQGKLYVIGGAISRDPMNGDARSCGITEAYDPATDTWELKAPMPTGRVQMKAETVSGKIYVMGGRTAGPYSTVNVTEAYDPATNSWATKAAMPYSVVSYASAAVNEKIYVIGGQAEFEPRLNLDTTQIYDTISDKWSLGKPAPVIIWQAAAGATTGELAPKQIYVVGGSVGFAAGSDQNYAYNPQNHTWIRAAPMPTARFNPSCAVVDDLLYVLGGGQGMSGLAVNEQYTPIGYGTTDPTYQTPTPQPTLSTSPTITPTTSPTIQPTLNPTQNLIELPYAAGNFYPAPNSTNVALNTTVSISFSRPPSICNLTLTPEVAIKERVFKSEGLDATYVFYFAQQLKPNTTYTVTVTYGQETAPEGTKPTTTRTWHFTTEIDASTQQLTPTLSTIFVDLPNPPNLTILYILVIIITLTLIIAVASLVVYFKKS